MSTRSVVFAETEKGIRGVYVHSDGHPEWNLVVLNELIERDGVGKVVATVLGKPSGWAYLDHAEDGPLHPMYRDGGFISVPGYGVQHAPYPIQSKGNAADYYVPEDIAPDDIWIEFVYLIREDGTVLWADAYRKGWDELQWQTEIPVKN